MKVCGSRHSRWCSGGLEKYSRGLQRRFSSRACDTRIPYLSLTHTQVSWPFTDGDIASIGHYTAPPTLLSPLSFILPPTRGVHWSCLFAGCTAQWRDYWGVAVNRVSGGGRGVGVVGVLTPRTSIRGGC